MTTPREDFEKWTRRVDKHLEYKSTTMRFLPRKSMSSEVFWNILLSVSGRCVSVSPLSGDVYIDVRFEDMVRTLKILGMCIDEGEG